MADALVPLLDLTDEELAALDGPPDGLVVSPYLEELSPALRDQAVLTAFRSLVARGLIEGPTVEQARAAVRAAAGSGAELAAVDVRMGEALSQALTLRRVAPTVLCAQRTNGELSSWRYVHVVDEELALDEVVEATGLHRFGLLRPADVPDALLDWLAPEGWDGADGPAQEVETGEVPGPLLDRLAAAVVIADVVVRRRDDDGGDVLIGTFAGPGLLVLSTTRAGAGGSVSLRPASRRTVRDVIAEQLGSS